MNIDYAAVKRVESLKPCLRFTSDIMDALIADDAKDIMVFATKEHPSPFHHNQWGILLKVLSELGIMTIDLMKRFLEDEHRENMQLREIQRMVHEVIANKKATAAQEKIMQQQRIIYIKQYIAELHKEPQQQELPPIYGGKINDYIVDRPKPLPSSSSVPSRPKTKLQT